MRIEAGYECKICKRETHRKGEALFHEHYEANFPPLTFGEKKMTDLRE